MAGPRWTDAARRLALLGLAVCAASCSTLPTLDERAALARTLAAQGGLTLAPLPSSLPLVAAWPAGNSMPADQLLTVYIEGDGHAWRTAEWPSTDPTPLDPVALRLAVRQTAGPVAWLSRPCQYVDAAATACPSAYWTSARYGPATTGLIGEALDILKARTGARWLVLVGYSGGGNVAASMAARRPDVVRLITVAANLDLDAWVTHHGLASMADAIDPALLGGRLPEIPQTHVVGTRDKVVPPAVVRSYVARLGPAPHVRVVEVPEADHSCCWASWWPDRLDSARLLAP